MFSTPVKRGSGSLSTDAFLSSINEAEGEEEELHRADVAAHRHSKDRSPTQQGLGSSSFSLFASSSYQSNANARGANVSNNNEVHRRTPGAGISWKDFRNNSTSPRNEKTESNGLYDYFGTSGMSPGILKPRAERAAGGLLFPPSPSAHISSGASGSENTFPVDSLLRDNAMVDDFYRFRDLYEDKPDSLLPKEYTFMTPSQPMKRQGVLEQKEAQYLEHVINRLSFSPLNEPPVNPNIPPPSNRNVVNVALNIGQGAARTGASRHPVYVSPHTASILKEAKPQNERSMSPRSKQACQEFSKEFRNLQSTSLNEARGYAVKSLNRMPKSSLWKVYLEMADMERKLNNFDEAAALYKRVHELEPGIDQAWLEWSKLQDECGDLDGALDTVLRGISEGRKTATEEERWHPSEALVLRALRLCERLNKIPEARELIVNTCVNQNFDKVARIVFEGAQLEARIGQVPRARKLYAFLMNAMPWYGPLYYEAFRLEETGGHFNTCLRIITRGLQELRRYGPLWFGLLRVVERADFESERVGWATEGTTPQLQMVRYYVEHAVNNINQELVWKIYYELAQIESRAVECALKGRLWKSKSANGSNVAAMRNELLAPTREAYAKSLTTCPANLRWKVLIAGARMELEAENVELCRKLLRDAVMSTHSKTRGLVYLDCSRVEEYLGNLDVSREILRRAQIEVPGECKICLEQAMLEARANNYVEAMNAAVKAVEFHSGAGRLWALLIQLVPKAWRSDRKRTKKIAFQIMEKSNSSSEDAGCPNGAVSSSYSSVAVTDTERSLEVIDSASTFEKLKVLKPSKEPNVRDVSTMQVLRKSLLKCALQEVPKSGEVWCEAARCCLNPMEKLSDFDLSQAHRYLSYSLVFTSQYGDCFIEKIRLELLSQVLLGDLLSLCGVNVKAFYERFFEIDVADSTADLISSARKRRYNDKMNLSDTKTRDVDIRSSEQLLRSRSTSSDTTLSSDGIDGSLSVESRLLRRKVMEDICSMNYDFGVMVDQYRSVVLTKLYRLCDQVDPNYGSTWFYCKMFATENLSDIFAKSLDHIIHELLSVQGVYFRAIMHYVNRCLKSALRSRDGPEGSNEYLFGESDAEERRGISEFLEDFECAIKSLRKHSVVNASTSAVVSGDALHVIDAGDGVYFSDDFTCALISHSRAAFGSNMSRDDMRKFLFSTEQVIP